MKKKSLRHLLTVINRLGFGAMVAALIVSSVVTILALRQNNLRAIELRDKVLEVDRADGDVESALSELRSYVHSHMNANLASDTSVYPPIQLKYRYERLISTEKDRVSKINERIYSDAQTHCERLNPSDFSGRNRVPCIQDYVQKNGVSEQPVQDALYKFDFSSPVWSPDLAGWSLVITSVLMVLILTRLFMELWLRQAIKSRY